MNKKGQYDMQQSSGPGAHPLLYFGIFVFVVPFLTPIIGWNVPKWISGVGVAIILIGAVLSIFNAGEI